VSAKTPPSRIQEKPRDQDSSEAGWKVQAADRHWGRIRFCSSRPILLTVENRLLKTARLAPGEPLAEVSELALLYDPEVDAYCLQLLPAPDEPPLAEYWFGSLEQAERQAGLVFGARFTGWSAASS
jgi:hypothetical protein